MSSNSSSFNGSRPPLQPNNSGLKRSTALFNLSLDNALLESERRDDINNNNNNNNNTKNDNAITTEQNEDRQPSVAKRAYSISPNISSSASNKLFKFSHSQFRRVRSDVYSNNNIAIDVENWSPFKDDDDDDFRQKRALRNRTKKHQRHNSTIKLVGSNVENTRSQFRFSFKNNTSNNGSTNTTTTEPLFTWSTKPDISPVKSPLDSYSTFSKPAKNQNTFKSSYRLAKPFQAVFQPAGLVSKKDRNSLSSSSNMPNSPFIFNKNNKLLFGKDTKPPDTPCKSASNTPGKLSSVEKPRSRLATLVSHSEEDDISKLFSNQLTAKKNDSSSDLMVIDSPNFDKKSFDINISPMSGASLSSNNFSLKKTSKFLKFDQDNDVENNTSPSKFFLQTPSSKKIKQKLKTRSKPLNNTPLNTNSADFFRSQKNASDDSINNLRSAGKQKSKSGGIFAAHGSSAATSVSGSSSIPGWPMPITAETSLLNASPNHMIWSPSMGKKNGSDSSLVRSPVFKTFDMDNLDDEIYSTTPTKMKSGSKLLAEEGKTTTPNSSCIDLQEGINTVTPNGRFYKDMGSDHGMKSIFEGSSNANGIVAAAAAAAAAASDSANVTANVTAVETSPQYDDVLLTKKLGSSIKLAGEGEFSLVFECDYKNIKYAVKRTKKPVKFNSKKCSRFQTDGKYALQFNCDADREFVGKLIDNDFRLINLNPDEEISILNNLKKNAKSFTGSEYLVNYISNFTIDNYNYIVTEFCENGSLEKFLLKNSHQRLDEFRVWKILTEILFGINFLHENGILHLDLKPANIFIDFEGSLKIGDFGLSTKVSEIHQRESHKKNRSSKKDSRVFSKNYNEEEFKGTSGVEKEGDREYIAPEVLSKGEYSSAADIFALGLITVEIAANIYLPENGVSWQKLRSGDLSDAGRLSFRDLDAHSSVSRPINKTIGSLSVNSNFTGSASTTTTASHKNLHKNYSSLTSDTSTNLLQTHEGSMVSAIASAIASESSASRSSLLSSAIRNDMESTFLKDGETLDLLVHWMIEPDPKNRPAAASLINSYELQYIELKRQDPAIVYEGEYGSQLNMDCKVGIEDDDDYVYSHNDSFQRFDNKSNSTLVKQEKEECTVRDYLNRFKRIGEVYKRRADSNGS